MSECLICKSLDIENLGKLINPRSIDDRVKILICKSCGHIQLDYENILHKYNDNDQLFDEKYNDKKYSVIEQKKIKKFNDHINCYLSGMSKVLDVGAGAGWTAKYFIEKNIQYSAVERVPSLKKKLLKSGAHEVVDDIEKISNSSENKYDLIILRHVLEHLRKPRETLKIINNLLSENGVLYLSVPNFNAYNGSHPFLSDFIRIVHISYFCKDLLNYFLESSGFNIVYEKDSGELLRIVKKADCTEEKRHCNKYQVNRKLFKEFKSKSFIKDIILLYKLKIKKILS